MILKLDPLKKTVKIMLSSELLILIQYQLQIHLDTPEGRRFEFTYNGHRTLKGLGCRWKGCVRTSPIASIKQTFIRLHPPRGRQIIVGWIIVGVIVPKFSTLLRSFECEGAVMMCCDALLFPSSGHFECSF